MILFYLRKESVELPVRHRQARSLDCSLPFSLVELPVVIAIDRVKERKEFILGLLDKRAKFCGGQLARVRNERESDGNVMSGLQANGGRTTGRRGRWHTIVLNDLVAILIHRFDDILQHITRVLEGCMLIRKKTLMRGRRGSTAYDGRSV